MGESIERIAKLSEAEIGPTEENVKQKWVVPLLVELGHRTDKLEFEYRTRRGGKLDILIKDVPPDCKVIIDTKNYNENLDNHIEQIKEYSYDENPLLTIIANGTELRVYSLLGGVEFERSLLYSFKRQDIVDPSVWQRLSDLLDRKSLTSKTVNHTIEQRGRAIKDAISNEERFREESASEIAKIDAEVGQKGDEIEALETKKYKLQTELESKISALWVELGLRPKLPKGQSSQPILGPELQKAGRVKAERVRFQELVSEGHLKDGQKLFLCCRGEKISGEEAKVVATSNKLKYGKDGQFYTKSALAEKLLIKHGKFSKGPVQGPLYWQTETGDILKDLEDRVRRKK